MHVSPWCDPEVARQQRELLDRQLAEHPWPRHFTAFAEAVRDTKYALTILEVGCGVGHGIEILDRAQVPYSTYFGNDISEEAIRLARERYPEDRFQARWFWTDPFVVVPAHVDLVIDGCALMHVDDWRLHLKTLCAAAKFWLILHRVRISDKPTIQLPTSGYGKVFPAWVFNGTELANEVESHGFRFMASREADAGSVTLTFARVE